MLPRTHRCPLVTPRMWPHPKVNDRCHLRGEVYLLRHKPVWTQQESLCLYSAHLLVFSTISDKDLLWVALGCLLPEEKPYILVRLTCSRSAGSVACPLRALPWGGLPSQHCTETVPLINAHWLTVPSMWQLYVFFNHLKLKLPHEPLRLRHPGPLQKNTANTNESNHLF